MIAHIEQAVAVVGPHHIARGVFNHLFGPSAASQIAQGNTVLPAPLSILRHGQAAVIFTDRHSPYAVIILALGALIGIQQRLPGGVTRHWLPLVDGKLLTRINAFLIAVAIELVGNRAIFRAHAAQHLVIQPIAQRLVWLHHLFGITVFRRQISQHLFILAAIIAQPIIIIDSCFALGG
ncbi:hypothetical protein D3C80_1452850 [compost metagenome]